jgi:ankyrin repeat protein
MISAIVHDDVKLAKNLLKEDKDLAARPILTQKLYRSRIFHWIYPGDTLLHLAAAGYRVEIEKRLLEAGADPNSLKNKRKSTPLHYSADGFITGPDWDPNRQTATILSLLEHGAEINLQDLNGATPLHRAVRTRCTAAVKCLLDAGADPAMENRSGSTPFHLAVQNSGRGGSGDEAAVIAQREIIKMFLAIGIDPYLLSSNGKSVADSARSGWIREMLGERDRSANNG